MKIDDLIFRYDCTQIKINQKKSEIELLGKKIEELRDEIDNSPNWVNIILKPLAKRLADKLNYSHVEIRGDTIMTMFFAKSEEELDTTPVTITFRFKPSILLMIHKGKTINVTQMTVNDLIRKLNLEVNK